MNIVNTGTRYLVYGEEVKTYQNLPVASYEVDFDKMSGFSLRLRSDLEVKENKIYGPHVEKVNKVLESFSKTNRNLGVILSGQKGIGKSLFARILAREANRQNLPLINVTTNYEGVANFLASIQQEVVVLFDEFEKTFPNTRGRNEQEQFLPLFDGTDNGKRLFVITCNEIGSLNSYLVNRPGRFHYHLKLAAPSAAEINEYLSDQLNPLYYFNIPKIVSLSFYTEITYDCLRAIVFELNNGYSLSETLGDLNIAKSENFHYNLQILFDNGMVGREFDIDEIEIGDTRAIQLYISIEKLGRVANIEFSPSDLTLNTLTGELSLPTNKVTIVANSDYSSKNLSDEEKELLKNLRPVKIVLSRYVPVSTRLTV